MVSLFVLSIYTKTITFAAISMKNKIKKITILTLVLLFLLYGCKPNDSQNSLKLVKEVDFVLGTMGRINVLAESEEAGRRAIAKAFDRVREIENKMSTSITGSDVYLLNKNAGNDYITVDKETLYVINKGLEYYELTGGDFNISIGALINLWGIGKTDKVPSQENILAAMENIDINAINIDNQSVRIDNPNVQIDLGGIAKGYAVDEAIKVLRENGIKSGLVDLGGDIYAFGKKADDNPWIVGIQDPEKGANPIASIPLTDKSIVTSGDYERFFMEDNIRYHHIIDPKTGYPVRNDLRSVTIISDLSIDGDVLSTAVFIMGLEKGMSLIESLDGVETLIITNDKKIYTSSGLKDQLNILNASYEEREL